MHERCGPVIFDLDGTLIDSARDLTQALNRVLGEHGVPPVSVESTRHMVGDGAVTLIERSFAAAGRRFDTARPEAFRQSFLDHYAECLTDFTVPNDGVAAVLERLRAEGRRLAVCTNKPAGMSEVILERLGLARYFDAVLGGDSLAVAKPHPAPLLAAIERAGGGAGAVMVGDSRTDVATARAASVAVVVVSFGYTRIAPRELGADAVIDHFDELVPALAALDGA
jgi:phosphoglycolate phosphatase